MKKITYFLIKIHKNILGIDTVNVNENLKLIPQIGPFAFSPEFFPGLKVNYGESGCPSWLRRRARFGIVDDDVRARGPGSSLASV